MIYNPDSISGVFTGEDDADRSVPMDVNEIKSIAYKIYSLLYGNKGLYRVVYTYTYNNNDFVSIQVS